MKATQKFAGFICTIFFVSPFIALGQPNPATASAQRGPATIAIEAVAERLGFNEPAEPAHVVGPLYFVGTKGLSSWLITTDEGHILLRTGAPGSEVITEKSIRSLGFDPVDIKLILILHAHFDGVGAVAYFKQLSGARVMAMEPDVSILESGGATDFVYANEIGWHFPPVEVDHVLQDGEVVSLGDVSLTAHYTPGHTKGSTSWSMTLAEDGQDYDVLIPDGTFLNSGIRANNAPPGIVEDYERTYRILSAMNPDIWLPALTSAFDLDSRRAKAEKVGVQAWVDPEGYHLWLASERAAVDADIAKGTNN